MYYYTCHAGNTQNDINNIKCLKENFDRDGDAMDVNWRIYKVNQ